MNPYASGRGWSIYHGDCLSILPELSGNIADAVVTDPPYSSGGQFRGDRARSTVDKYVTAQFVSRSDFSGDNLDQRVFMVWSSWWLAAARTVCNEGAVLCAFTDWRQIPALTDAVQCGGWVWRNLGTWWKPGCRMIRNRFSSSAEYLVYATNGAHESEGAESSQNVIRCPTLVGDAKEHIAEKPVEVVEWALSVTRHGGTILDPFLGSGTTAVACIETGRKCIGIELSERYCEVAARRLARVEQETALFADVEKPPTQSQPPLFTDLSPPLDTGQ